MFVSCLTSQQQASVSQGRICSDNFTRCHAETQVADQTFYLTQSQYADTGPTGPCADPITPGAWQGSHWSANFEVTGMTRPRRNLGASGIRTPGSSALEADALPLGHRGGECYGDCCPLPESSSFLCPLLSLSIPLPLAVQCHLSNDSLVFQLILCPLSTTVYF